MSITANEEVVLTKEDVQESKDMTFGARRVQFAHKFTGGEKSVDLANLVLPSELAPMVNPSPAEIAGAHLSLFKKNLRLSLSRGIELKPYAHFLVTSESRIQFVNDLYNSGGAQAGEILFGEIDLVPTNSIITADARRFVKTGVVSAGQTVVPLGHEFQVNANPFDQVGDFVFVIDGRVYFRNALNAAASPLADGNFHEIDSGNGYGTQIELNIAPVADVPYAAIYGLQMASGDLGLFGAIEQLQGSLIKLVNDAAPALGNPVTDYFTANPSQLERRSFGDRMLNHENRIVTLEAGHHVLSAYIIATLTWAANTNEVIVWGGYDADRSRGITVSGSSISFTKAGIYRVTINARYLTDVWFKHFMKNQAGTIIGESNWAGGSTAPGNYTFMAYVDGPQVCTLLAYASSPGMTIQTPAPSGSPQGQVNRIVTLTIEET